MAYIQKTTPPPNKVLNFSLKDFSGGLNNASDQLKPNEASSLLNMAFVDESLMEKRKGQDYYDELIILDNATTPAPDDILFIDEYKPYDGTNELLRSSALKVYLGTTKIADVLGKISGINYNGKYIFADGTNLYVYGKFPQTETTYEKITGTAVATPVLMKIVSPASDYTPLDTTHTQGITRYNYTNSEVSYEPCQNEVTDTYLGANVIPEGIKYIISHNGRLYMSGANKDNDNVYITDVQNPYYCATALPLQLPPNSDMVVGMHIFGDSVIVGRNNDLYAISGETNNPDLGMDMFKLKRLNTHTGFANHSAIDIVNNYLFFLGHDGNVYALSSVKYDEKTLLTVNISKQLDLYKDPINLTKTDIANACSVFFKDEWYLSIKDKILIYSYKNKAWTLWNNFNATSFYILENELIWGNDVGCVCKFGTKYLDFELPYQSYWYSKYFDMDDPISFKQFREFFIVAHTFDDVKSDINLWVEIDYADVTDTYYVKSQKTVWGEAVWGDRFIDRNIVASLPLAIYKRGRVLRFKISNGYFLQTTVNTIADLSTVPNKKQGLLVKVLEDNNYYLYFDYNWKIVTEPDLNQRFKIYQINCDYEMRGKR